MSVNTDVQPCAQLGPTLVTRGLCVARQATLSWILQRNTGVVCIPFSEESFQHGIELKFGRQVLSGHTGS